MNTQRLYQGMHHGMHHEQTAACVLVWTNIGQDVCLMFVGKVLARELEQP